MDRWQILDFDSKILGFKVARILSARLAVDELVAIIAVMRAAAIRLVYWQTDSADQTTQDAAKKAGGFLASRQVTYLIDLATLNKSQLQTPMVSVYTADAATPELEQLALQAGNYSRFRTDPRFPDAAFHAIYRSWIANSCNKTLASAVQVVKVAKQIVGLVTLGEKNQRGDIGLLAVHAAYRGRHFGEALVKSAQAYFIEQGYRYSQVVTQEANLPACKLYAKCGYHPEKIDNYYHLWL